MHDALVLRRPGNSSAVKIERVSYRARSASTAIGGTQPRSVGGGGGRGIAPAEAREEDGEDHEQGGDDEPRARDLGEVMADRFERRAGAALGLGRGIALGAVDQLGALSIAPGLIGRDGKRGGQ